MFYTSAIGSKGPASLDILTMDWHPLESWNHANLRAPYWRFYWNAQPGATITVGSKRIEMLPRAFYFIPPETDYATESKSSPLHFYVHFLIASDWTGHELLTLPASREQQSTLRSLTSGRPDTTHPWQIVALVSEALSRLPRAHFGQGQAAHSARIRQALRIIDTHLPEPVAIADVARQMGMNLNAFIRRFKEELGQTPARYQRDRRIAAACLRLHHSEDSIERIAENCGFCDRHHFTRTFTQVRGISPAAFRRLGGNG